ncbi:MAG: NADH:flavin oxidoreductase [Bacteroidaceae bacterium]|jgi:2,4-dienoyl-CoA reductase-like NADH-dependent reductase (Old Yellow Enzyme family)|nr:NADH:flavin oxidoreductase [Bacteroidaceae bacterium]
MENRIFQEAHIGPLTLRNRTIRSAAFESMCPGHEPSQMLYDYHTSVARGGVGMTTVAYAAVEESGLSFDRQLVMRPEIIPGLRRLTEGIHKEGAAAGIQLGHCGNMSHKEICGCIPVGASTGFNLYSPTLVRGLRRDELPALAKNFGRAVNLAREAGFDSVEIHCGHGYLIDQFLNTYFNRRRDEYGGSLENRMRFMTMCMEEVMKAAGNDMAVVVKMNMRDGLKRPGTTIEESIEIAKRLQQLGTHAIVLSGGLVSATPMYVMRGEMPIHTMTHYMDKAWLKYGVRACGKMMVPTVPYQEAFFLEDALRFRQAMPDMKFIYVGGLVAGDKINEVLSHGFEAVQMARSLLNEPDFVNRLKEDPHHRCGCRHSNYCIARMYSVDMACHQHLEEPLTPAIVREIERIEKEQDTQKR